MADSRGIACAPHVDYGQGNGAWNPSTRAPVYQQVERARFDAPFAAEFAADVHFSKSECGSRYHYYETWYVVSGYADLNLGTDCTISSTVGDQDNLAGYHFFFPGDEGTVWRPFGGRFEQRATRSKGYSYLYNDNTLNASRSWVGNLFGLPGMLSGSSWYRTEVLVSKNSEGNHIWGFVPAGAYPAGHGLELLKGGHCAFSAAGFNGVRVCLPWAPGYEPVKTKRGRPECGNGKAGPVGNFYR